MSSLSEEERSLCEHGLRLAKKGDLSHAQDLFRLLIEQNPRESFFFWLLGNAYTNNGLPELAVDCFKHAIDLSPNCVPAWGGLGRAYTELEQWPLAEAAFRTRLELDANPNHYIFLANVLLHKGEFEEVLICCEKAIALDPINPDAYITISSALCFLRRFDEALEYSKKAIDTDTTYAEPLVCNASVLCQLGRFDEASDALQLAIDIDPTFAPAYCEFGCLQYSHGDVELAESYLRSSLELDASCFKPHFYLALVLRASRRYSEARLEIERCRQLKALHTGFQIACSGEAKNKGDEGDDNLCI